MKLTKEECLKSLDEIHFEANNSGHDCGYTLEKAKAILERLINEHFEMIEFLEKVNDEICKANDLCKELLEEDDKLIKKIALLKRENKALEEVREQGSSYMAETQRYHNLYQEVLADNELLHRENKALADDNEMKCAEIEKLKSKIKKLERNNA